jgi:hypothetical protein
MPDGLTRTCPNGGSQTVRMPRSLPRVLNIEWNNCQVVRWITWDVTTGPGQITLFSDDFLPKHVAGIRLGNSTRDVIVKTDEQFGEDAYHTISTQNVRMTGVIPMFVGNFVEDTYIPSAIEITGFLNDAREIVYADPGRATNHDESSTLADKVLILGMSAWLQEGLYNDEDQYLVRGKFTYSQVSQYYGRQTTHLGVDNLRVHRITDYGTWTGSHSIDGKFDYQYNDAAPAGCTGGRFSVRTRTPLNIPSLDRSNLQDAGELSVNGVVTARYYSTATIPAELPAPVNGMLLNMAVRDVGTFNYDEGNFPDPMRAAANCQ